MKKKTIVQIVVSIAAFGVSGVLIYNQFFNNPNNLAALNSTLSANAVSVKQEAILPNGPALDFENAFKNKHLRFDAQAANKLDASTVGIPEQNLIMSGSGTASSSAVIIPGK